MHKIIKLPKGSSFSESKVSYSRRGNDGEEIEKHAIVSFHVSKDFERITDNQILKKHSQIIFVMHARKAD